MHGMQRRSALCERMHRLGKVDKRYKIQQREGKREQLQSV